MGRLCRSRHSGRRGLRLRARSGISLPALPKFGYLPWESVFPRLPNAGRPRLGSSLAPAGGRLWREPSHQLALAPGRLTDRVCQPFCHARRRAGRQAKAGVGVSSSRPSPGQLAVGVRRGRGRLPSPWPFPVGEGTVAGSIPTPAALSGAVSFFSRG
jgi:hypothetical protein